MKGGHVYAEAKGRYILDLGSHVLEDRIVIRGSREACNLQLTLGNSRAVTP